LLYYRDGALMAQPFDDKGESLVGDAAPVIDGVDYSPASALAAFGIATVGNLVILRLAGTNDRRLTWFNRTGQEIAASGPRGDYFQPRLSPNSDRIAFTRADEQTGNRDVWSIEVARGVTARLTTHGANDWFPIWSSDGRRLVFGSDREGRASNYPYLKKSMDPGTEESGFPYDWDELGVAHDPAPFDWSRDGRWVSIGSFDIWVVPVAGTGKPFPFVATSFNEGGARFSPNGKWLAYASDETGRPEVYVRPFAGAPSTGEGKVQISSGGAGHPVWRADGQELFYLSSDLHLYAVDTRRLAHSGAAPVPGRLFRPCPDTGTFNQGMRWGPWNYQYDTVDGQRFVFTCHAERPGRFVVLMNWSSRR
jgi:dipeptidyl aminopeptidase/acylaminoacyl peptidase